jgi:hypothetical protein
MAADNTDYDMYIWKLLMGEDLQQDPNDAFGDVEFEWNLRELLDKDPIAALAFDPSKAKYILPEDINNAFAYYSDSDMKDKKTGQPIARAGDILYGPQLGGSKDVIIHEYRHQGNHIIKDLMRKDREAFRKAYGDDVTDFLMSTDVVGSRKPGDLSEEFLTEMGDNPWSTFNKPRPKSASGKNPITGQSDPNNKFLKEAWESDENAPYRKGYGYQYLDELTPELKDKYQGVYEKAQAIARALLEEKKKEARAAKTGEAYTPPENGLPPVFYGASQPEVTTEELPSGDASQSEVLSEPLDTQTQETFPRQQLPRQQNTTTQQSMPNPRATAVSTSVAQAREDGARYGYAEGGTAMDEQMSAMFKSSRGDVDPVSGNDVPTGSLPEEVRDDIPAQLSEGEYVVPADVVRYYGVKFFEDLRGEAKMGWQAMEQNGRIGGEPVAPEGMEMGGDELPFDISELQFMEVPDEDVVQAFAGKYIGGYADGGFIESIKETLGHIWSNDNAKKQTKKTGSKSWEGGKGDAIGGGKHWQSGNKSEDKEPDVEVGTTFGSPQERSKQMYGARQAYRGYADGGYALSEGDVGYEEQGSLGFGTEGIGLGGGVVMRLYRNDAGDEIEIPFLNGEPQVEIPEGYYPVGASESVTSKEDTTVKGGSSSDGSGFAPEPAPSINFKELSIAELQQMVKDQQGYTGDAIAAGLGLLNPLLSVAIKLAMWDQSKRVEAELERRAGLPDLSPEDRTAIQETLIIAKKEKPTLMKKIFGKVKDKVLDVVDPQERVETSQGAPTRVAMGLTPEERLMQQGVLPFDTEAKTGVPPQSAITTEELPPAGLEGVKEAIDSASRFEIKNEDGPVVYYNDKPVMRFPTEAEARDYVDRNQGMLPAGITYNDLLMGEPSPVNKTFDLGSALTDVATQIGGIRNSLLNTGMSLGEAYKASPFVTKPTVARPTIPSPEDYARTENTKIDRETTAEIAKAQRDLATPAEIQAIKDEAAKKKEIIANRAEGARLGYAEGGMTYTPEVYDFLDKYDPNTASKDDKEFASFLAKDAVSRSAESQGWGNSHEAIKEQSRRSKEATQAVRKASGSTGFFDRGTNPNWREDSQ